MQILTLHRDENRHAYFAACPAGLTFDPVLRCWIAGERETVTAILQSSAFAAVPFEGDYEVIERRFGEHFPNLRFAFRHIPLSLRDDRHRLARRRMAAYIAEQRGAVAAAIPGLVSESLGALDAPGTVDLMNAAIEPLVTRFIALLTGLPLAAIAAFRDGSKIFDRMLGLGRRRQIEAATAAVRLTIRETLGPQATEEEEGLRLALISLGRDALIGTLAESLLQLFRAHPGQRLSDMAIPELPPEGGVPYVERVAVEAVAIAGTAVAKGDRLRLFLQSFAYSPATADRGRIFGLGVHSCLGRQMSLDLWSAIRARVARLGWRVTVIAFRPRAADYVFTYPETLVVRLNG